ncbi:MULTISPECIES: hypothetical protein [Idiomarinaceae]|uniref:Transmembrane protein n=3 Tax=Pseudidiomarina TaxID=2800384 RepID=A0A368UK61_9GAMM|nr:MULTISPECIES: hypothetical protein [Idiomarinaceae]MDX1524942.1 hypothetical protein [Pseudidiomarina maritima]MRJ40668.1 hypothetical protein [Idiomarina sp. FeN1]NCU58610.1 hypothetical protein [Idiomarina sp. FenA--70]NCU61307.1 hypothetical protein [Idiomarina sp. FenBw--71]PWW07908.1 hypothetical protein DET45_12413 [Pseudidiomarina maritima]
MTTIDTRFSSAAATAVAAHQAHQANRPSPAQQQTAQRLLTGANYAMLIFLGAFLVVAYLAWGLEAEFPLMTVAVLHFLQIFLAGLFKLSYVVRLIAQHLLGQQLR